LSILEATDRGSTVNNADGAPGHIIAGAQAAGPGLVVDVESSTPEDSVVSNIDESTRVVAITTWETGKAA